MVKHTKIKEIVEFSDNQGMVLNIKMCPEEILDNWSKCSDISKKISDYYSDSFSDFNSELVFIALNELIENAVKFSKFDSKYIRIDTLKSGERLRIKVYNNVTEERFELMKLKVKEIENSDLNELFIKRIRDLSMSDMSSGIGLILINKNPHYRMGVEFIKNGAEDYRVAVSVDIYFRL